MSPGKGTPRRTIRVPDDLWERAAAKAEAEGTTVSDVIREKLEDYVATWPDSTAPPTMPPSPQG